MVKEEKRKNFERLVNKRVATITHQLRLLTNLTNKSFYDYTDEDMKKIVNYIDSEWQDVKNVLLKRKKGAFKL